jgi:hypothetical protein
VCEGNLQVGKTGLFRIKHGRAWLPSGKERVDQNTHLINYPRLQKDTVERPAAIDPHSIYTMLAVQFCKGCTHIDTIGTCDN